jgi:hypothetical protein
MKSLVFLDLDENLIKRVPESSMIYF